MPALTNLGNLHLSQNRTGAAAGVFQRILALEPGHAAAWYGLGASHDMAGRREKALAAYERALTLDLDLRIYASNPNLVNNRHMQVLKLLLYRNEGGSVRLPLIPSPSSDSP